MQDRDARAVDDASKCPCGPGRVTELTPSLPWVMTRAGSDLPSRTAVPAAPGKARTGAGGHRVDCTADVLTGRPGPALWAGCGGRRGITRALVKKSNERSRCDNLRRNAGRAPAWKPLACSNFKRVGR